jgi:hypothetical protein
MRRKWWLALLVVAVASPAWAQGPGLFIRSDCTLITGPVTGSTWCFDSANRVVKVWNGAAFDTFNAVSFPISTTNGGTGQNFGQPNSSGLPTLNAGVFATNAITNGAYIKGGAANTVTMQTTPIPAADGGTGVNGATTPNGQLLIGNGSGFTLASLTSTNSTVTITPGAGSIDLAAAGGGFNIGMLYSLPATLPVR